MRIPTNGRDGQHLLHAEPETEVYPGRVALVCRPEQSLKAPTDRACWLIALFTADEILT